MQNLYTGYHKQLTLTSMPNKISEYGTLIYEDTIEIVLFSWYVKTDLCKLNAKDKWVVLAIWIISHKDGWIRLDKS
jgi:hypothetical protein